MMYELSCYSGENAYLLALKVSVFIMERERRGCTVKPVLDGYM